MASSSNLRRLGEDLKLSCLSCEKALKTPRVLPLCNQWKLERTARCRRKMSRFISFCSNGFSSPSLLCHCEFFGTSVSNRNNGKILGFSHSPSVLGRAVLAAPVVFQILIGSLKRSLPWCPFNWNYRRKWHFSNILNHVLFLMRQHRVRLNFDVLRLNLARFGSPPISRESEFPNRFWRISDCGALLGTSWVSNISFQRKWVLLTA